VRRVQVPAPVAFATQTDCARFCPIEGACRLSAKTRQRRTSSPIWWSRWSSRWAADWASLLGPRATRRL